MPHQHITTRDAAATRRRLRAVVRGALALLAFALLVLASRPSLTRAATGPSTALNAYTPVQWVLLVDDSDSMQKTDPSRVSLFAAQAMFSLLDDRDSVSLVRLNGVREGVDLPSPQPLSSVRADLARELDVGSEIAKYAVPATPCTRALEAIAKQLNGVRRAGTRQVVLYLTDGACFDDRTKAYEKIDADKILAQFRSHADHELGFFLLHFPLEPGEKLTDGLFDLVAKTGGQEFPVSSDDTSKLVKPFADAVSQAQGFEAFEVDPSTPVIGAHPDAERVRLLAIADATGGAPAPLSIDFPGGSPAELRSSAPKPFSYDPKKTYRFAAAEYVPGRDSVKVAVSPKGSPWRMIALPEYRLHVDAAVLTGDCDRSGAKTSVLQLGGNACLTTSLRNHQGTTVGSESFGGGVELRVGWDKPGETKRLDLPLTVEGTRIAGTLPLPKPGEGYHVLHPYAVVRTRSGKELRLRGAPLPLAIKDTKIAVSPSEWAVGEVRPGTNVDATFTVSGNFEKSDGKFVVGRPEGFPACLHFVFNGVEEGGAVSLLPGDKTKQEYKLRLRADSLCSLTGTKRPFDVLLTIAGMKDVPNLVVPVKGTLVSEPPFPETITIQAEHGRPVMAPLVTGNFEGELKFEAALGEPTGDWPKDLALGFAPGADATKPPTGELGRASEIRVAKESRAGASIWARADACCSDGAFRTSLTLKIPGGETRIVPVVVNVPKGSWWSCHGRQVKLALGLLAGLLALLLLRNLYKNTYFIKVLGKDDQLQAKLPGAKFGDNPYRPPRREDVTAPTPLERALFWLTSLGFLAAFGKVYVEAMRAKPTLKPATKSVQWLLTLVPAAGSADPLVAKNELPAEAGVYVLADTLSDGTMPRAYVRIKATDKALRIGAREFVLQVKGGPKAKPGEYLAVGPLDRQYPMDSGERQDRIRLVAM